MSPGAGRTVVLAALVPDVVDTLRVGYAGAVVDRLELDRAVHVLGDVPYDVIDGQHRLLGVRLAGERVAVDVGELGEGEGQQEGCHPTEDDRGRHPTASGLQADQAAWWS
jgi:hypothetical protein